MSRSTFLVTVFGPDRIGVGAELFHALHSLEGDDVQLMDVAQITIRGTLVLCAEVSSASLTRETLSASLSECKIEGDGMRVSIEEVTPRDEVDGRRLLVTLLAPEISGGQLEGVFHAIASSGA